MNQYSKRKLLGAALGVGVLSVAHAAHAHNDKRHTKSTAAKKEQKDWGIAGERQRVARTVECRMLDTMRFVPERVDAKLGVTIRFTLRNTGKTMHEFVIGTQAENAKHAALMLKFPNMEHDEPYMAHVPPGKTGQIVWTFNRPGEFQFACLIAGHYEAGMVGTIVVNA